MRPVSALPTPPSDDESLAELPSADLKDRITLWAGRVAAGEAQLLRYVGDPDLRHAWFEDGILSCTHWLSWKLGFGQQAAYERVRVARALRDLPQTAAAFAAGRVSFSQVRAITRMALPTDEDTYISMTKYCTGAQLERLARGIRRARRTESDEQKKKNEAIAPSPQLRISYAEEGAVFLAAIEAVRADLEAAAAKAPPAAEDSSAEESTEPTSTPKKASAADGMLQLCRAYLQRRGQDHPEKARRDRSKLTVQIDPLSGWARLPDGELLPPGPSPCPPAG
jgi:hypothetical protein